MCPEFNPEMQLFRYFEVISFLQKLFDATKQLFDGVIIMKSISIISWMLLLGFIFSATKPLETKPKKNTSALLSLSVLPMINKTSSKNYQYLSKSIASGIRKEIKSRFKYKPYKSSLAEQALLTILKKEKKRWLHLDESHIQKISSTNNIDILIYGSYTKGKSKGKIDAVVIRIGIFIQLENKTHWIQDLKTSVDASMFTSLGRVSEAVVNKIYELTSKEAAKKNKKSGKKQKTSTIQRLTKESLNVAEDTRSSKFLEFGIRSGFLYPVIDGDNFFQIDSAISTGYLIDIYFTQSIALLNPAWVKPYLPDLHAFISLEEYNADSLSAFRLGMNFGFLYTIPTFARQAVKLGATFGGNYESIGSSGITPLSGLLFTMYVLVGYEYHIREFQVSLYSRVVISSDQNSNLLGFSLALSTGYAINF